MTPLTPIVDVPRRVESWPLIWKLVVTSTVSMLVAVVAFAWYAAHHPRMRIRMSPAAHALAARTATPPNDAARAALLAHTLSSTMAQRRPCSCTP